MLKKIKTPGFKRLSKKKMEIIMNEVGGVDLMVERDGGNEIRILTGKGDFSVGFWIDLRELCEYALDTLDPRDNDEDEDDE